MVRAMGRAAGGVADCRCAVAPVRARAGPAVRLFRAHPARRDSVAVFHRPFGLRKFDQDICQQRGIAVPRTDRRHHPDAVPELATRRGGAAGVSDHADRPAAADAEGGAGELRAEAQRVVAARHGAGKRRGAGGGQGVQPAAPRLRLVHHAQQPGSRQDRLRGVPVDHGRALGHDLGAAAAPRGARDRRLSRHQGPDHGRDLRDVRECVLGGVLQHRPSDAFHSGVDPVGGGRAPHSGTAGRADPRRRSRGRARAAAHHQRHHLRPRLVQV